MVYMYNDKIIEMMKARGFKQIGEGFFGVVFQSPKSKEVLKLFHRDEGYKLFIKIVTANPQCIHFPKFRAYHKFPNWDDWHAIKLEPLERITDSEWDEYYWLGTAMQYYKYDDWPLDTDKFSKQKAIKGMKKYPTLAKACDILEKARITASKPWPKEDIHSENLMKRADGTIVIIDPFA